MSISLERHMMMQVPVHAKPVKKREIRQNLFSYPASRKLRAIAEKPGLVAQRMLYLQHFAWTECGDENRRVPQAGYGSVSDDGSARDAPVQPG